MCIYKCKELEGVAPKTCMEKEKVKIVLLSLHVLLQMVNLFMLLHVGRLVTIYIYIYIFFLRRITNLYSDY